MVVDVFIYEVPTAMECTVLSSISPFEQVHMADALVESEVIMKLDGVILALFISPSFVKYFVTPDIVYRITKPNRGSQNKVKCTSLIV